jgi:hypothetical protein
VEHQIDGTHLLSKKITRQRFRASIFASWNHTCAYCGAHATTIDHIRPKAKGGTTHMSNCVPACLDCNVSTAHTPLWVWWTVQLHWDLVRAHRVYTWITEHSCP